jgi:hypothetical protein
LISFHPPRRVSLSFHPHLAESEPFLPFSPVVLANPSVPHRQRGAFRSSWLAGRQTRPSSQRLRVAPNGVRWPLQNEMHASKLAELRCRSSGHHQPTHTPKASDDQHSQTPRRC